MTARFLFSTEVIDEEWREVPGYPGLRASSFGRVWLPPKQGAMPNGNIRAYETKPRFGAWATGSGGIGRYIIQTRDWGTLKIARLVCLAFHGEPPSDKPYCLHIDENSRNNRPHNLKWGTQKENLNAPGHIAYRRSRRGENSNYAVARRKRDAAGG